MDKKIVFLVVNMLVSALCLGLIIGSSFLDNERTKILLIAIALGVLIIQKVIEIIFIKETRKVSIVVLIVLGALTGYYFFK